MANVLDLRKNIVTYTQDKTEWRWKEFSLKQICKSDAYSSVKVKIGTNKVDLKKAVAYYQKLQDAQDWTRAKKVKEFIWTALDEKSRARIKAYYDTPEVRIASINRENTGNDAIVAFYALNEENYYNGKCESIVPTDYIEYVKFEEFTDNGTTISNKNEYEIHPKGYTKPIHVIREIEKYYPAGSKIQCSGFYKEEYIIGGNGEKTYSDYMETSPDYKWLPKAIEIAKQFGVEPNWQPCIHSNKRGIGLTAYDAKELQVVANWYSGLADIDQADIKYDWSDKIWLHHENGVDSVQISKREYEQNKDKWQDWKQTETRDFRCDLYEDEDENELN